jgi:hypothetical protein
MREFELAHVSDAALLRDLAALITQERMTTAALLAHLAEVDARRLYVPAGYSSMHAYCVGEWRLSEDAAYKRIQAARACRQFPILFEELSKGRLHLAAVCLLAPHRTPDNAGELIAAAAANRRKSEVEEWLARRFMDSRAPMSFPSTIRRVAPPKPRPSFAMGDLLSTSMAPAEDLAELAPLQDELAPLQDELGRRGEIGEHPLHGELAPGQVGLESASSIAGKSAAQDSDDEPAPPAEPKSQVVERFEVRVTIDRATYERLRYAQTLMSHAIPDGDLGRILGRAVEALITVVERQKFAATRSREFRPNPASSNPAHALQTREPAIGASSSAPSSIPNRHRYIPSNIRRAVWRRDQGQCTFVGASGHRCQARRFLEFDHVEPVARGGRSTVEGLRLRCRTHNQYEAERALGRGFMARKREEARRKGPAGMGEDACCRGVPSPDAKSDERGSASRNLPRGKLI